MTQIPLLAALLVLTVGMLTTVSAQTSLLQDLLDDYEFSHDIPQSDSNVIVFWTPGTTSIDFAIAFNQEVGGWVGFGFSNPSGADAMLGAFAVIGMGNLDIEEKILASQANFAGFTNAVGAVSDASVAGLGPWTILKFTREYDTGNADHQVIDPDQPTALISAYGPPATPAYHPSRYAYSLTLSDGTGANPLEIVGCDEFNCCSTGGTCSAQGVCECNEGFIGDDCCQEDVAVTWPRTFEKQSVHLGGRATVYWNLLDDDMIDIAVEAETDGWVGFGFSETGFMIGSEAVIGWRSSNGEPNIDIYRLEAKDPNQINPINTIELIDASVINTPEDTTVIQFKRLRSSGNNPITDESIPVVIAIGTTRGLSAHATTDREQNNINFITGLSVVTTDARRVIHGILMIFSWGILIPIGALIARHKVSLGKKWWPAHPAIQGGSYFVTLVAFVLAIIMVDNHFGSLHQVFGLIITILGMIQVVVARFRCHITPEQKKNPPTCMEALACNSPSEYTAERYLWEVKHIWLGRFLILFAFATCLLGIHRFLGFHPVFYAYLGFCVLFLIVTSILEIMTCKQTPE